MILAPSILSADFSRLADDIARAEAGGAGWVHADVMDGHFVPNLTLGPAVVAAVRRCTKLPIDTHLMVQHADRFIDPFIDAGASWISVHVESTTHLHRTLEYIRSRGARAGIALNPATPLSALDEALPYADYVLVMSVNPGFSGQRFIPTSVDKVRRLRATLEERKIQAKIEVDGGVGLDNIRSLVTAGAEIIVAGAAAFGGGDAETSVRALIEACR
jgi:ribulose-phosphate 3-epimerase